MIRLSQKGNYAKITRYLEQVKERSRIKILDYYGRKGCDLLSSNTPFDSGLTASSWYYEIENTKNGSRIIFRNSNVNEDVPIAIILQYGHGTGTGGWVEGIDYINPPIQTIFKEMSENVWREVTNL